MGLAQCQACHHFLSLISFIGLEAQASRWPLWFSPVASAYYNFMLGAQATPHVWADRLDLSSHSYRAGAGDRSKLGFYESIDMVTE
jgi:hypothetical protein